MNDEKSSEIIDSHQDQTVIKKKNQSPNLSCFCSVSISISIYSQPTSLQIVPSVNWLVVIYITDRKCSYLLSLFSLFDEQTYSFSMFF